MYQRFRSHLGSSNGSFVPSPSCSKRLLLVLAVCHSMGPTYVTRAEFLDALRQQRDHFDQALRAVTAEQEQMHQLIVSVDIVADQAMRAAGRLASHTRRPSQPRRLSADNDDEEHAAVRREDEAEAGTMTMRMALRKRRRSADDEQDEAAASTERSLLSMHKLPHGGPSSLPDSM